MKADKDSADGETGDLQASKTFPSDADSVAGLGSLTVTATQTYALTAGVNYYYDFMLVDESTTPDTITPLGEGRVKAANSIKTPVDGA